MVWSLCHEPFRQNQQSLHRLADLPQACPGSDGVSLLSHHPGNRLSESMRLRWSVTFNKHHWPWIKGTQRRGTAQKELETKQCPTLVRRPWASRLSPTAEIQDTTHRGREVIKALRDCLGTRELTWQGLSCMEMVTCKTHNSRDRVWTAWRCPCAKHTQPRLVGFVIKALL